MSFFNIVIDFFDRFSMLILSDPFPNFFSREINSAVYSIDKGLGAPFDPPPLPPPSGFFKNMFSRERVNLVFCRLLIS